MAAQLSRPIPTSVHPPRRQTNDLERPYPPDFVRRTILWIKSRFHDLGGLCFRGPLKRPETFHQEHRRWEVSESICFRARKNNPFQLDEFNWPILFISCPPYQFMETLI
jgi:hypothetical protein